MSASDALRREAKRRASAEWDGKMSKVMSWLKAADFIDEQTDVPAHVIEIDVLAEALRTTNVERNGHPMTPWTEIVDDAQAEHVVELWRKRAIVVQEEINAAVARRRT